MSIDEKASIRSILEALSVEGVDTKDVAKQISRIGEKPLRRALKEAGYEFSNAGEKGWFFTGEGKEPLDKSIFDYVKRSSSPVKQDSSKVISFSQGVHPRSNSSNAKVIERSPTVHEQFTPDEIKMIKEMLQSWKEKQGETPKGDEQPIHERIKNLPNNEKTRKTIVIDNEIGKQLDDFCKGEKVNKSDVLHLALKDFFDKFE